MKEGKKLDEIGGKQNELGVGWSPCLEARGRAQVVLVCKTRLLLMIIDHQNPRSFKPNRFDIYSLDPQEY